MTNEYKIIYMRFKSQLPLRDIAEIMEMSIGEVAEVIDTEVKETRRQINPEGKYYDYIPENFNSKHTKVLKPRVNQPLIDTITSPSIER